MNAYLDHNATTRLRPGVRAAMAEALEVGGNPSSVHQSGRKARRMIEKARADVAALVGVESDTVIFTSGGTEANMLALAGLPERRLAVSAVEHDSVRQARSNAHILPVNRNGLVDCDALGAWLAEDTTPALVSIMAANNETGIRQPIATILDQVHENGGLVHCDAVQAVGRIGSDEESIPWQEIDLITLSAHKLGGPMGSGALILRESAADLMGCQHGGGQEQGLRAGTENLAGIVGFGHAAEAIRTDQTCLSFIRAERDRLEAELKACWPQLIIVGRTEMSQYESIKGGSYIAGKKATRLGNTSSIILPGMAAQNQIMALDLAGISVSAGAACSSGKIQPSHVLKAMGWQEELASCAIRVSLGWSNNSGEIDYFIKTYSALCARFLVNSAAA